MSIVYVLDTSASSQCLRFYIDYQSQVMRITISIAVYPIMNNESFAARQFSAAYGYT